MNQTRVFLLFAWMMVATLLWWEWGKFKAPPEVAAATAATPATALTGATNTVPSAQALAATTTGVPPFPQAKATAVLAVSAPPVAARVEVTTDVLHLVIDGGNVLLADLLQYPQTKQAGSLPVRLFNDATDRYYVAQSGWTNATNTAPTHLAGFVPEHNAGVVKLGSGNNEISVPFIWQNAEGVSIRRTYTLQRGQYTVQVRDDVVNRSTQAWQGSIYRQLMRRPPQVKQSMTNPESFSFSGATWFSKSNGYQRRPFADYLEDGNLNQQATESWIAMLQHHFFSAWIPQVTDTVTLSLEEPQTGGVATPLIREVGPSVNVAPGQQASSQARLYIGPKLIAQMKAQKAPGLERAVDYSRFSLFAVIGQGLFWILSHLHSLFGNWGWAIIGLVVLVKLAMFPLSTAQYKSFAKMRKFQPRIAQLKERYGDDKQKFQTAMMELYKKEKINPVGGCLPMLVQMPIFLALYWVLNESVELRQAPWMLWIQDLTARDPYFILPALNVMTMWLTQKMQPPAVGMDPMQQKILLYMPLVFGVTMAFFPAGLVLYWVTNGGLGLLQQWWITKKYGENNKSNKTEAAK